jgi:hypothetical protein
MAQRDINIISTVYDYEGYAVEHIRKLFFKAQLSGVFPVTAAFPFWLNKDICEASYCRH